MKTILRTIATISMLVLLGALAGAALVFAVNPQWIAPVSDALRMHREQDRNTLEVLVRQVLRFPPGPSASGTGVREAGDANTAVASPERRPAFEGPPGAGEK